MIGPVGLELVLQKPNRFHYLLVVVLPNPGLAGLRRLPRHDDGEVPCIKAHEFMLLVEFGFTGRGVLLHEVRLYEILLLQQRLGNSCLVLVVDVDDVSPVFRAEELAEDRPLAPIGQQQYGGWAAERVGVVHVGRCIVAHTSKAHQIRLERL